MVTPEGVVRPLIDALNDVRWATQGGACVDPVTVSECSSYALSKIDPEEEDEHAGGKGP